MMILFIANARIPSERAMSTAIMKQCEAFAASGIDVELVVPERKNILAETPFSYHGVVENFKITYLPSIDLPALSVLGLRFLVQKASFFLRLCIYVRSSHADILYTREPELVALIPTRAHKFVEVHHLFGLGTFGKLFLSRYAGIIAITHGLKADLMKMFRVAPALVHVAPSGVDLAQFESPAPKDDVKMKLGITTPLPIALYIGSLEEWKGYRVFLDAQHYLEGTVQCMVIGGTREHVEVLQAEYPSVRFFGSMPQRDLGDNQQIADVLVIPNSNRELISARHTSPLKVFTHMTSGVPIVASKTEAISEILSSDNAVLVKPDDPEALAQGILTVIQDKALAHRIGAAAKQNVQVYDWSHRTRGITTFIQGILGTRPT